MGGGGEEGRGRSALYSPGSGSKSREGMYTGRINGQQLRVRPSLSAELFPKAGPQLTGVSSYLLPPLTLNPPPQRASTFGS